MAARPLGRRAEADLTSIPAAVRRLCATDTAAMRAVLALYADAFDDRPSYLSAQPGGDDLRDLLGRSDFIQLAVFAEGEAVVGALSAYVLPKFE